MGGGGGQAVDENDREVCLLPTQLVISPYSQLTHTRLARYADSRQFRFSLPFLLVLLPSSLISFSSFINYANYANISLMITLLNNGSEVEGRGRGEKEASDVMCSLIDSVYKGSMG